MKIKDSNTKLLLKYIAGGAIVLLSLTNPQLPYYLLKAYLKNKKFQQSKFLKDLKRLQQRELVSYQHVADGQIKIAVKSHGKKMVLQYEIDDMKIKKPKFWDGKWRLIIFDIPVNKRRVSDAFSRKLKSLDFYRLQDSVYIHPFPCEKEIEFIASIFNIRQFILILEISNFEGLEKLTKCFSV